MERNRRRRFRARNMKKGVRRLYTEVAPHYERVNHILTMGLDRIWRRRAGRVARRQAGPVRLDICTGTGEMAEELIRKAPPGTGVTAVDGSFSMLSRARSKPGLADARFALAEVDRLPFPNGTFDMASISFATRNLHSGADRLAEYLKEFHRVLKPGGLFMNLETSQPRPAWLRRLFHFYVRLTVRPLGRMLSGSSAGYGYLAHTIPRFPGPVELTDLLLRAGFAEVRVERLFFGVAAVHLAEKSPGPVPGERRTGAEEASCPD